jgi:hypothetical protein
VKLQFRITFLVHPKIYDYEVPSYIRETRYKTNFEKIICKGYACTSFEKQFTSLRSFSRQA